MHVGLDLGGTDLKSARVDGDGRVHDFARTPSDVGRGPDGPLDAIVAAALARGAGDPSACVGLGCPGAIHPVSGALVGDTPHLPFPADFPLRESLERRLGRPVVVDNDANLAALAEHHAGAARGARVSITVTVGTGVGGGIVVDGRVLRGAWGGAGELGHLPLGSHGPECRCGVHGCAEPLAGGEGLVARLRVAGLDVANAREAFARAGAGEPRACAAVAEMADRLAAMIACAVQLVQPERVVLGGGVSQAGEALLGPVRAALVRYTLGSHRHGLQVVPAELGERAGVVGAALFASGVGR